MVKDRLFAREALDSIPSVAEKIRALVSDQTTILVGDWHLLKFQRYCSAVFRTTLNMRQYL